MIHKWNVLYLRIICMLIFVMILTGCKNTQKYQTLTEDNKTIEVNQSSEAGDKRIQAEEAQNETAQQENETSYVDVSKLPDVAEEDFDKYASSNDFDNNQVYDTTESENDKEQNSQNENGLVSNADSEKNSDDDINNNLNYDSTIDSNLSNNQNSHSNSKNNDTKNEENNTCTLYVECSKALEHIDKMTKEKASIIPEDGVIYSRNTIIIQEGDTVFSILQRELQNNRIPMEFSYTAVYDSDYIEGINNLYEFDCGELSGWMYCVNGTYPNYGCSQYVVKEGDTIEFHYTCDLGRDL